MQIMPDRITTSASYSGAAVSVFAGLTLTEWGVIIGILTALATFVLNGWYQRRQDRRNQELAEINRAASAASLAVSNAKLEKLRGE